MLSITPPPQPPSYPVEISVTAEQVHVDHGTQMGMLGLSYQRLFTPQWSAGLSAYGAVTGDRGGFFAWGANGAHRQTWGPWQAEAGLFIGGGGGSPGWVGGGLMLRPHIELNRTAGTTLVLVTHDAELAQRTQRILKIKGGKVESLSGKA